MTAEEIVNGYWFHAVQREVICYGLIVVCLGGRDAMHGVCGKRVLENQKSKITKSKMVFARFQRLKP
jgi:hypothetical protein